MASLGWTVLDLMTSEISRFRAISSLWMEMGQLRQLHGCGGVNVQAAAGGLLYLLVQGSIGPGGPPTHHRKRLWREAKMKIVVVVVEGSGRRSRPHGQRSD